MRANVNLDEPFSAILGRLRGANWQGSETSFSPPWGIDVPAGNASFYILRSGACQLAMPGGSPPTRLVGGDFVVLAHGTAHRLCDCPDRPSDPLDDLLLGTRLDESPATTIVQGHVPVDAWGPNPFRACWPALLKLNQRSCPMLQQVQPLLDMLRREQTAAAAGWQAIVNHLVHMLFVETVRAFVFHGPELDEPSSRADGWLRAASDPAIGRILGLIHNQPRRPWTVHTLAQQANMSKSAFSQRFSQVVGQPPLQYVTECRIQRACELLSDTRLGVKQIASLVGYESPSAFSNAFKRWIGRSPASYRRHSNNGQKAVSC